MSETCKNKQQNNPRDKDTTSSDHNICSGENEEDVWLDDFPLGLLKNDRTYTDTCSRIVSLSLSGEEKLLTKLQRFLRTGDFVADGPRVAVDLIVVSSL